jgi:CBS domain-containing protein
MKVKDLMTTPVQCCGPDTNLAAAAGMMWDSDCGILPVVTREGRVIGLITDRDICMAVATKHRLASDITVWETTSGKVQACSAEDDLKEALTTMAKHRVRRLPVIDADGLLQGMLSLNDVVLLAEGAVGKKAGSLTYDDVMRTMKAICGHRLVAAV